MSCLAEERFVEILDRGGLDATRPEEREHLDACDACRESWATVAAAAEILAEARPKAARGRLVPVLAAAAMLLAIVGVIVWKSSPPPVEKPRDPVVLLLEGAPEDVAKAREAILKQGKKAIPMLVAARPKFKGSARLQGLQDLIFDLKRAAVQQDPEAAAAFRKLEESRIDLGFETMPFEQILVFMRDVAGVQVVLDPTIFPGIVDTFHLQNATVRTSLEVLCAVKDLDFDYRYGEVFVSTPMRLWSTDPAVALPGPHPWETQILAGEDAKVAAKLRSVRITMEMQNTPLSTVIGYLSEISGVRFTPDATVAAELISFKTENTLRLGTVLRLMTLSNGWDVRIADGAVHIVPRRR